jgi:hypothetical protein
MNREEIIKLAREAQLAYGSDEKPLASVTRFADLVAAHEREACAKVCEGLFQEPPPHTTYAEAIARDCADAIRARKEK